jgi:multiple sugar transport system ATP-binding protein
VGDGVTLPMPRGTNGEEGQSVIFGARPEHLSLSNGGGFPATVVVVEPTGPIPRSSRSSTARK